MSQENVDLFSEALQSWNRRDLAGVLRIMDPEIRFGVQTELPFTVVASFSKGRITHFIDFGDKQQALEAAGLRE